MRATSINLQGHNKFGLIVPYLFIFPALFIYGLFIFIPILNTLRLSFHAWTGFSDAQFIGLDNYRQLWSDGVFRTALMNNVQFIVFYTAFPIIIGLILTAALTRRRIRGLSIFRAGFFIPYVMPMVVVGVVWRWLYNPLFGPLNNGLKQIGLDAWAKPWLGDFDYALPAVGLIATWVQYGFCMVLFIAGVQKIDETLYDAAKVDGANAWHQLRHITIPGIRAEISVAAVTTFIAALRIFDLVFVTTRGGPGEQTMVTSMWLYRNAFQINRVGYAASIAVVQSVLILGISYVLVRFLNTGADEEA
jgi:raffinose/stachyose/melibiose transport system permease protein